MRGVWEPKKKLKILLLRVNESERSTFDIYIVRYHFTSYFTTFLSTQFTHTMWGRAISSSCYYSDSLGFWTQHYHEIFLISRSYCKIFSNYNSIVRITLEIVTPETILLRSSSYKQNKAMLLFKLAKGLFTNLPYAVLG